MKNKIQIEPAKLSDIRELWRLFSHALTTDFQYFPEEYITEVKRQNSLIRLLVSRLRQDRLALTARKNGKMIGYIIGSLPQATKTAQIYWLYVDPKNRGKSVGLKLLAAAFREFEAKGADKVHLSTHSYDQYYHRRGFRYHSEHEVHGVPVHMMEFALNESGKASVKLPLRWVVLLLAVAAIIAWKFLSGLEGVPAWDDSLKPKAGRVLEVVEVKQFTPEMAEAGSRLKYGDLAPKTSGNITKVLFRFATRDTKDNEIEVYARAYIPPQTGKTPVLILNPGTTGIGDQCAASLEQPEVKDWANYESHALTYASNGYVTVVPDHEGTRDPSRIHHYMVGELEGRVALDSLRAVKQLPQTSETEFGSSFVSGYSQGGHTAFWADKINKKYAPEVKIDGVIGWGSVMDVEATWRDITNGADINWFGPYVLFSYADYYGRDYNLENILLPRWRENLTSDVLGNCIDTIPDYWGGGPTNIYTAEFLEDLKSGRLPYERYGELKSDMAKNRIGDQNTKAAKLINQGSTDDIVLNGQQIQAKDRLCANKGGSVTLKIYSLVSHYATMKQSLNDTLAWMKNVAAGQPVTNSCNDSGD